MNSKRILMIFVLFALLIATTSVAFASENVDTSIDDGNVIGDIDNGVDQSDDDENWPYYDDDGYLFNEKVDYIEGDDDGADDSNDLDDEDNLDDSDDEDWEDYDDEDDLDDSDDEDWEDYDDSDDLDDEDWEDYDDYNLDDSDNPVTDDWTVYEGEDAFYNSSAHIKYLDKTYYSKDYSDGNGSGYKFVEEWDEEYEDGTVVHIYRTTAYANGAKTVASSCTYLGNTHNDTSNDTSDKNEGACDDASNDVAEKAPASMAAGASPIDDNTVSVSKSIATASSLLDDNNQQQDQNTSANTTNEKSNDVEVIQENDNDLLSIIGLILAILISIIVIL